MIQELPQELLIAAYREKSWCRSRLGVECSIVACPGLQLGFEILGQLEAKALFVGAHLMNVEAVFENVGEFRSECVVIGVGPKFETTS
jgi:hypothetical protein